MKIEGSAAWMLGRTSMEEEHVINLYIFFGCSHGEIGFMSEEISMTFPC